MTFIMLVSPLKQFHEFTGTVSGVQVLATPFLGSLKKYTFRITILCGLVFRVPGYRSRGPGSIPGAIRFSEK
jgi:hypothetical protein